MTTRVRTTKGPRFLLRATVGAGALLAGCSSTGEVADGGPEFIGVGVASDGGLSVRDSGLTIGEAGDADFHGFKADDAGPEASPGSGDAGTDVNAGGGDGGVGIVDGGGDAGGG